MSIEDLDIRKVKEELANKLSNELFQLFTKSLKVSISIQAFEKLQKNCKNITDDLFKAVELKAVDLSVRLAKSTDEAFEKVMRKLDAQEAKMKDLKEDVRKDIERLKNLKVDS